MKRRILRLVGHLLYGILLGVGISSCAYQDLSLATNQAPNARHFSYEAHHLGLASINSIISLVFSDSFLASSEYSSS